MITRRTLVASAALATAVKPALLGGTPVRTKKWPTWPVTNEVEEQEILGALRSGRWGRGTGKLVERFEAAYSTLTGAKHCLAVANGTSALITSLNALGIGAGDEVIVPPYTFIATINSVLLQHALPVFVDTDRETFQIDASKVEAAITPETRVLLPVHMGGASFDVGKMMEISRRRNVPLIEDAAQAHLGEWRNRKVGSYGLAGCFSFQASKNLNSGEGGAIISSDEEFIEKCFTFHNNGRSRKVMTASFTYQSTGANLRLTEFQAAILSAQMTRLEEQSRRREMNAAYLTSQLAGIAGMTPQKLYPGCTRNAWHLYMFRYQPDAFAGLTRERFIAAMRAEGIPVSSGYSPLNREPFLENVLNSRGFRRIYGEKRLAQWREQNQTPQNDQLCQEALWLTQTMLLDTREGMDQIVEAVRKVQKAAGPLTQAA
ncbi:MAG: DegT/DnrJ/EryC1/StrS family aminotransferase [Acidobacteria bacterium]|nr:DegT/DnrJ/EryC1/StrS family aminotransferase [Acidobacteriota bacterium]